MMAVPMSEPVAYWMLIAVLHSTLPLPQALSMRLYHAALDLHRREEDVARLTGELAMGEVRRLHRDLLLGTLSGPGFEAQIDTPHGSGQVRFILTRQALESAGLDGGEPQHTVPRPMAN